MSNIYECDNIKAHTESGNHNSWRPSYLSSGCALSFVILIFFCCLFWFYWNWNPLPNDEEMIANFQANRDYFEEVVRRYREYYDILYTTEGKSWYEYGNTLEIFQRIGIDDINYIGWQIWLPNPYSVESAIEVDRIINSNSQKKNSFDILWRKQGALELHPVKIKKVTHKTDRSKYFTLRYGWLEKRYIFFPETPHIENGMLYWASQTTFKGRVGSQYHKKQNVSIYQSKYRVLSSLNHFPDKWRSHECVFKHIEPQWFLCVCNGRYYKSKSTIRRIRND